VPSAHAVDREPAGLLAGAGSVAARPLGAGRHEVLARNNYANTVTRHKLDEHSMFAGSEVLVERGLDIPDGIALSHDGRWLAVSNHNANGVFVYEYAGLSREADPVGILRGVSYPHGIRFGSENTYLAVADAGAPFVHLFLPSEEGWKGVRYPSTTIRVMVDETFARGRHNRPEGGPKSIDVDLRTNVLVVTAECLPVAFFDLSEALAAGGCDDNDAALLQTELDLVTERAAALAERTRLAAAVSGLQSESEELRLNAAAANAQLAAFEKSILWRLTAPVRRTLETARAFRRRRGTEP
jgi:hypothetical protein